MHRYIYYEDAFFSCKSMKNLQKSREIFKHTKTKKTNFKTDRKIVVFFPNKIKGITKTRPHKTDK